MKRGIYNFHLILCSLTFCILIFNSKLIIAQWVEQYGGTKEKLNDVVMLNSTTAIIAGEYGAILKTSDGGKTWQNTAPPVNCINGTNCILRWESISFIDKQIGIIVGSNVVITNDGGSNWSFIPNPSSNNLISVLMISPENIIIGDDLGYVYQSLDSGKTWKSRKLSSNPIHSIFYYYGLDNHINTALIYAVSNDSLFTKSENPSSPWMNWGSLGYFRGLGSSAFKGGISSNGTFFIVGVQGDFYSQAIIIRLRPPDSHWYSVGPPSEIGELSGLSIPSHEYIYTSGTNGKILKSSNGGDYWVSLKTPTKQRLSSIFFFDNETGFAVGDSGTILYTSSGGISPINKPPLPFHLLTPVNEDTIFSLPKSIIFSWKKAVDPDDDIVNYTLLISADTCSTWKSFGPVTDTSLPVQWSDEITKASRYFWTIIANDGMLATPALEVFTFNINTISGVANAENSLPHNFALYQNYPNPFNPTTKIRYSINSTQFVTLNVYDALGRKTAILVNREQRPGTYEVEFDGSNHTSGIYFYRLQAGNFSTTKKFILMK